MCVYIAHTRAQSISLSLPLSLPFPLLGLSKSALTFIPCWDLSVIIIYTLAFHSHTDTHTHRVLVHWRTAHRKHLKMSFKIHAKFHSFDSQQNNNNNSKCSLPLAFFTLHSFTHTHTDVHVVYAWERERESVHAKTCNEVGS